MRSGMSIKLELQTQNFDAARRGGFVRRSPLGGEGLDSVLARGDHRSSWKENLAMLNLRFLVIVINCWRDGTGKLSWWKKWTLRVTRRGVMWEKKRLQVSADTHKGKPAEVRKCDVGYDPLERYFPPDIAVRRRGTDNLKCLELRQERERLENPDRGTRIRMDGWSSNFKLFNLCCPRTCWIV